MLALLQSRTAATTAVAVLLVWLARSFVRGRAVRKSSRKLPGPPHNWILGNLIQMGEVSTTLPRRVHPHVYPHYVRKNYKLGSWFRLDVWPFGDPMIIVMDPDVAQQFSVQYTAPKSPELGKFLYHLAGPENMVSLDGSEWSRWRRIFNSGFSSQHLTTLVPGIVDDVLIYVENLTKHADQREVFRLEEDTTRLTFDVIGKVVLGIQFDSQKQNNVCIEALREQLHLLPNQASYTSPLTMYNPVDIYRRWRNDRIMTNYLGKILDERFAAAGDSKLDPVQKRRRTVIDLALESYNSGVEADTEGDQSTSAPPVMDSAFRHGAITQIRVFLFAGHDTTSSTICFVLYMLLKHPQCLETIRQEHASILGPIHSTAETIKTSPHLLNKLEYTMAVIKETMRLYPPASGPRFGEPGLMLRDPETGEQFPTEGHMIWLLHHGLGRNEQVWGEDVDKFRPKRFMPEHAAKIPDGAWRPFETGPRGCIGQTLALLEARIILALICRRFEFSVALDALDELRNDGSHWAKDGTFRQGPQTVDGDELYQVLVGAGKPREGMPCRVCQVEWEGK